MNSRPHAQASRHVLGSLRQLLPALATVLGPLGAHPGQAAQGSGGQDPPSWEPPETVVQEVKTLVSEAWDVPVHRLLLQWSRPRAGTTLTDTESIELLGSGRNGRWMVAIRLADRDRGVVSLPLRAGIHRNQAFARMPLDRGEVLNAANMEFRPDVHWGPLNHAPPSADSGWVAQRRIRAGEALIPPGVQPPLFVVSGRPVRLLWKSEALTISLRGTAVGSAALGETVFVRTEEGHRMSGIVTGPSTVLLSNPGKAGT